MYLANRMENEVRGMSSGTILATCSNAWLSVMKFGVSCHDRDGACFQDISDGLLLRQDQAPFGGGFVDGNDQYGKIGRLQEVSDDPKPGILGRDQGSDPFF